MATVIVGSEVDGRSGLDVRIEGQLVTAIAPHLRPEPGDTVIAAGGGALLPGLHDHHVHLLSLAASLASVPAGPPDVRDAAALTARLRAVADGSPPGQWIRGVGYHQSVAGDLDRLGVAAAVADRPVRLQHRSGALWILNSEAVRVTGLDDCLLSGVERDGAGRPTGRLWRMDGWLHAAVPAVRTDLRAVSERAAAAGVTGFTDATPSGAPGDASTLVAAVSSGEVRQRLHLMSAHHARPAAHDRITEGPYKIMLDDDDLPPADRLAAAVAMAHLDRRPVAVHCVTRVQLLTALVALGQAGSAPGDRIEHGAVIPVELLGELRHLSVTVVTQPHFVAERGDRYLDDVDADDLAHLYRCASLTAAGIPVAAGTDAPFGGADPWAAMRAAVDRRTERGAILGRSERVPGAEALALFLGQPDQPGTRRRVQPGGPADLCLLAVPLAPALQELSSDLVAATLIGGQIVHRRDDRPVAAT